MASDAVLNIRLPKELKEHGNQVLKRNHVTVTSIVKDLYEYMEREQKIPDCLLKEEDEPLSKRRRHLLREASGTLITLSSTDSDLAKEDYLLDKYGDHL